MNEENYIKEKREKRAKLYRNKLRRIFKEKVMLININIPEIMEPEEYFEVLIENKVYFRSYFPIEYIHFKDMLKAIYESYWYDIYEKYINIEEISKYLPIRDKEE